MQTPFLRRLIVTDNGTSQTKQNRVVNCICAFISTGTFVLALAGCASLSPTDPYEGNSGRLNTPPPHTPVMAVSAVHEAQDPRSQELDEQSTALGLRECIDIALRNNPDIAAGESEVDVKRAERDVTAGERWPSVHALGGYTHYLDDQRLVAARQNNESGYFSDDLFSADLALTMPLYSGGRITNSIKAAELLRRAAEHTLARTKEELVYNVSSVFYAILVQHHVIESLEFSHKTLQEHLKRVNDLIDVEKAAKVDRIRTEVRLANVDQRLLQEQNALEIQRHVLASLLGLERKPVNGIQIDGTLVDTPTPIDLNSSLKAAFAKRADYEAAQEALEAQARKVDAARGEREPAVSLQASYGGRWASGGSGEAQSPSSDAIALSPNGLPSFTHTSAMRNNTTVASTLTPTLSQSDTGATVLNVDPSARISRSNQVDADSFVDVGQIGVRVDVPLFEGGRISGRIRAERAKLAAAQQRLRKLELQIRLDIETASLNATSAQERIQVTERTVAEAKESLRIEREKYDFGRGTIVDVLDAQSALLESQTSYYRALADYNIALAQLRLATGEDYRGTTQ